ncbi:MAG: hypothetical protein JNM89_13935 [Hyphomicrobiaceae bacterium]|nr:hypothetical protein [Hyphomicrobiaceae bacterium]
MRCTGRLSFFAAGRPRRLELVRPSAHTQRMTSKPAISLLAFSALALGALNAPAFAGGARHGERVYSAQPLKDCTRINGRWGYYGNLWCSPREQDAFDRFEARRHARSSLR